MQSIIDVSLSARPAATTSCVCVPWDTQIDAHTDTWKEKETAAIGRNFFIDVSTCLERGTEGGANLLSPTCSFIIFLHRLNKSSAPKRWAFYRGTTLTSSLFYFFISFLINIFSARSFAASPSWFNSFALNFRKYRTAVDVDRGQHWPKNGRLHSSQIIINNMDSRGKGEILCV